MLATEEKKKNSTSAKKSEFPSLPDCGVFASEVNEILQATPPKIRRIKNEKQKNGLGVATAAQQRIGGRVDSGAITAIPRL